MVYGREIEVKLRMELRDARGKLNDLNRKLDAINDTVLLNVAKAAYPPADAAKVADLTITAPADIDQLVIDTNLNLLKTSYDPAAAAKVAYLTVTAATDLDSLRKRASKAFCHLITNVGAAYQGYNIASVVRNGVGEYRITFTEAMSTTTYTVSPCVFDTSGTISLFTVVTQALGYIDIETKNSSGVLSDASEAVSINIHEYV